MEQYQLFFKSECIQGRNVMKKSTFKQAAQKFIILSAFVALATSCTKKRDASLPEDLAPTVFSLAEFGDAQPENSGNQIRTLNANTELSFGEQAKASNEKGLVAVDSDDLNVSDRLKFMFAKLEIPGKINNQYKVTFAVDREYLTAFKVVDNIDELSILEKALAMTPGQVKAQLAIQKTQDQKEVKTLISQIKDAKKSTPLLVPIFKYKVTDYGVLRRTKNELKEETSVLALTKTDWSQATHIVIGIRTADRLAITVTADKKEELNQVFVMNAVDNKVMAASTLNQELGISTNLKPDTQILTRLGSESLIIYEITNSESGDLTESEKQTLKNNGRTSRVEKCGDDVKKLASDANREKCVIISRLTYPISYVVPSLPEVNYEGSKSNAIEFKPVIAKNSAGLVKIVKNSIPTMVSSSNLDSKIIDPRYSMKVSEIAGKEFFFRRTFEQATSTAKFVAGMMGDVQLVKFELQENRLVVKKTQQVINFKKDQTSLDQEEVMAFPVQYFREIKTDGAGSLLATSQFVTASRDNAEIIQLDWSHNTIPVLNSPLAFYADGQCFRSVNDQNITDLDQRLGTNGMLSFSYTYSVTLDPACASQFDGIEDYNGPSKFALVQGIKERLSFKLNDGKTDKSYVPNVPFTAQNALGYGVFTNGNLKPSQNGLYGREGSQLDLPASHDFRNGKVITYTIGGLPENEGRYLTLNKGEKVDLREIYIQLSKEVIEEWNKALHRSFAGTPLDRAGDYINYVVNGENGLNAKLGDLDRHFIWFENTVNTNFGILGVSQAGTNPRSGIITADAVIIYSANINYYIEYERRNLKLLREYNKKIETLKKAGQKELAAEEAAAHSNSSQQKLGSSQSPVENRVGYINKLVSYIRGPQRLKTLTSKQITRAIPRVQALGQSLKSGIALEKTLDANIAETDKAYIHRIVKAALNLDSGEKSLENIEQITAQEILKSYANSSLMSDLEKAALRDKIQLLAMRKRLIAMSKNRPGCLTMFRESLGEQYATMSFAEAIKVAMKPTLAHEMGHSLGLTHNFIASTDKNNFNFSDEKGDIRNYSSVMDYMVESQQKYAGPGPYDVFALRAAYTGLLESDKGLISVDKLKASAGGTWTALTSMLNQSSPVKKYKYCTDIDVGWEPACQRHDLGTSASEIVSNIIKDYNEAYIVAYHDYDRLKFDFEAKISAFSRAVDSVLKARQFMDETFYKAITRSAPQEQIQDYVQASLAAYKFLLSIVRTPDASTLYADASRFEVIPYQYQEAAIDTKGQPLLNADGTTQVVIKKDVEVIERKSVSDKKSSPRRYDTLGIENNKLIALEVLTLKGYPSEKYRSMSLNLSFLDFEKYIMEIKDPRESLILNTLSDILNNQLQPAFSNDHVIMAPLPASFSSEVTNSMRVYAGISAILSSESTTLKDKDNFATLFKVGASQGLAPKDRLSVSQFDAKMNSQKLNYYALDNGMMSGNIVTKAHKLLTLIINTDPIKKQMTEILLSQIKGDATALKASQSKLLQYLNLVNAKGELISAEELKLAPQLSLENQVQLVSTIFETYYTSESAKVLLKSLIDLSKQFQAKPELQKDPAYQAQAQALVKLKTANADLAQALPMMALAQRTLMEYTKVAAEKAKTEEEANLANAVGFFLADQDFEADYGILLNSIDFLNKLTRMTNPELTR